MIPETLPMMMEMRNELTAEERIARDAMLEKKRIDAEEKWISHNEMLKLKDDNLAYMRTAQEAQDRVAELIKQRTVANDTITQMQKVIDRLRNELQKSAEKELMERPNGRYAATKSHAGWRRG